MPGGGAWSSPRWTKPLTRPRSSCGALLPASAITWKPISRAQQAMAGHANSLWCAAPGASMNCPRSSLQ
eukprot:5663538-Pyramimonas_sp.AAC.1